MTRARQCRAEHGFTLIELMIAITIALFLCGSMVAVVFAVRSSFKTQDGLVRMQENARFMLSVMNTTVHNAGYFPNPLATTALTAFPTPATPNGNATTFATGQFITGATSAGGDSLNVRFQSASGDGLMNCQGAANTSGADVVYTSSFSVNAASQLVCAVSVNGLAPSADEILIDNVAAMNLLYSVDTDGDGNADSYRTAAYVTAAGLWNTVSAVQITLTLKDLVNSTAATTTTLPKQLLHTINLMNKP